MKNKNKISDFSGRTDRHNRPGCMGTARLVLGKLMHRAPPIKETLDPANLEQVLANLFPLDEQERAVIYPDDDPLSPITEEKMADAIGKMVSRNVAPGPDEIPGRALAL